MKDSCFLKKEYHSFSWIAIGIPLLFSSCMNSISDTVPTDGSIPIALSTSLQSRVSNNLFEQKDTIGVYLLAGDEPLSGTRHLNNEPFFFNNSIPTSKETLYYPYDADKCTFVSYFPFRKGAIPEGSSEMIVSVAANQQANDNYDQSDFLIATAKDIVPSTSAVSLNFIHQFSLINIELEPSNNFTAQELLNKQPKITLTELFTRGTYNLSNNKLSNLSVVQDIIPKGEWRIEEGKLVGKTAVILPQTVTGEASFIKLQIDNRDLIFNLGTDLRLEGNKMNELTIPYNNLNAGNLIVSIKDWGKGTGSKLQMQYYTNGIALANLPFNESKICDLYDNNNQLIAQLCKEYLLGNNLDTQAIVAYSAQGGKIDYLKGTVLKFIGDNSNTTMGGTIVWNKEANTFQYTPGAEASKAVVYVNDNNGFQFTKTEDAKSIKITPYKLVDKRGEETKSYSVVKIGTQLWMAEELSTTKDIEGKNLTAKETLQKNENSSCYIAHDNAIFYNFALMNSTKLIPNGWQMPDRTAWETLVAYINNDYAKLKSSDWNYKGEYSNDLTGFHATSIGMISEKGTPVQGVFTNKGLGVALWYKLSGSNKPGRFRLTGLAKQTLLMDLGETDDSSMKGCAIRLLKQ